MLKVNRFLLIIALFLFAVSMGSCGDELLPATPTGLSATAVSSNQTDLSWDASPEDDVAGYTIYRDAVPLESVSITSFSDTALSPDTGYCYTVSAYNAVGSKSGQSNEACATTLSIATITINHSMVTVTDGTLTAQWHTQYFFISVKDTGGYLASDVEIWISYPWAVPDTSGFVQLYDGDAPKDSPMSVKTDENGSYILRFDFLSGGGLEYIGNSEVHSGSVSSSATFEVKAL